MASILEKYQARRPDLTGTDLEQLKRIYNSQPRYAEEYGFGEFVYESTKDSSKELDEDIKNIINPEKPFKEIDYKEKFVGEKEPIISKETRRTIGGIYDRFANGLLNTSLDIARSSFNPIDIANQAILKKRKYPENIEKALDNVQRDIVQKGVSSILKPALGEDIYDEEKLQEPETFGGQLTKEIGAFGLALATTKKVGGFRDNKTLEKLNDTASNFTKRQALRQKRINTASAIGEAEVASQIVFGDTPEAILVSDYLNGLVKSNNLSDTQIGAVIDWLDADMDDTAAQRRLALLIDNSIVGGVIGGGLWAAGKTIKGGYNVSQKQVEKVLQKIKENPEAVERFKKTFKPITDPITRRLPTKQADDVFVEAEGDDLFTKSINLFRKLKRGTFTSRGMKSQEMFEIIKRADSAKLGIKKEARNIFDTLNYRMKTLARKENIDPKKLNDDLIAYMKQEKGIKDLPSYLRQPAKEARHLIDDLSKEMLDSQIVPEELKKIIRLNIGKYLRESYELYENKKYKPSQDAYDGAIEYIANQLKAAPKQLDILDDTVNEIAKDTSPERFILQAKNIVDQILKKDIDFSGLSGAVEKHLDGVFSQLAPQIQFQAKKNIDEPIKKLLGQESLDASTAIFRSITNLGTFLSDINLYDELYEVGKGKWFFKESDKLLDANKNRVAATISGEGFGKLNGVQTTKQIAKLFDNLGMGKPLSTGAKVYSALLTLKGFGQAFATVYSLTTHARNTIGGAWIMASNGLNPFDKESIDSFKLLRKEIFGLQKNKDKALQDLYVKYQKLGLVNQNVRKGEFTDLINESANIDWVNKQRQKAKQYSFPTKISDIGKAVKVANDAIIKTYVAEDDLWRIAAFRKELKVLQKAFPNKPLKELEREAAGIIRNTMPTYDMVPEYAKNLRRLPFGNFYSFFAERWRNNYHTVRQSIDEIRSGNEALVSRGYQRLSAKIGLGYLGAKGINETTKYAYGVTPEEEKAIRDVALPFWSEKSTLAYKRDEDGQLQYVDLSYTDPDAPFLDVLKGSMDVLLNPETPDQEIDELLGNAIIAGVKEFAKPFLSQSLLTKAIIDSYTGRDSVTGEYISGYNPEQSVLDNSLAIANHIGYKVLLPAQIPETIETAQKIKDDETTIGEYLASEFSGQKFYTLNPKTLETSLYYKFKEYQDAKTNINDMLDDGIRDAKSTEELLNVYTKANAALYDNAVALNKSIRGARTLNVDEVRIRQIGLARLSQSGLNKEESQTIIDAGLYYTPIRLTDAKLKRIYRNQDYKNIDYQTFKNEYDRLYVKLESLPLVELDRSQEEQVEAANIINSPYRMKKFEGGLVQDEYPVPFVKKDPKDRESVELMGATYEDQMNRLGLNKGGPIENNVKSEKDLDKFESSLNKLIGESQSKEEYINKLNNKLDEYANLVYPSGLRKLKYDLVNKKYGDMPELNYKNDSEKRLINQNARSAINTIQMRLTRELNLKSEGWNPSKTAEFLKNPVSTFKRLTEKREQRNIGGLILKKLAQQKGKTINPVPVGRADNVIENFDTYSDVGIDPQFVKTWQEEQKQIVKQREKEFGLSQRTKQNPKVKQAIIDLSEGRISNEQVRKIIDDNNPVKEWDFVPTPPSVVEIASAITGKAKNIDKINLGIVNANKDIVENSLVGLRLDIPAYNNYDTWVVAVHKGQNAKTDKKKVLAFSQTGWIRDVEFVAPPKAGYQIATGKVAKTPVARMEGKWKKHDTEDAVQSAKEYLDNPEWTQIGYNPYRASYFYDRKDMMPVLSADEVIQVGPFVIAKNVVKGKPTDDKFVVKFSDKERFNFYKGGLTNPYATGDIKVDAVMEVESSLRPDAVSSEGAKGLMQIMPDTAKGPGFGIMPLQNDSIEENIRLGREYLFALEEKYKDFNIALMAYNWGTGNVDNWIKKGSDVDSLPSETRRYVGKVHAAMDRLKNSNSVKTRQRLAELGLEVSDRPQDINIIRT